MLSLRNCSLPTEELETLIRRLELVPQLLRRRLEEEITALVPLPAEWLAEAQQQLLGDQPLETFLGARGWQAADLDIHLRRPEALNRYAQQRFGPGLEERFLASKGGRDQVIYSLLRVRDPGLARELWIRLEEGETTFAEAAAAFSDGPEAHRKGVMGPMAIGQLQPQLLADWLRSLRPGELRQPEPLGEWHVMVRLEQLTPVRFDAAMRAKLLLEELDSFLQARVQQLIAGELPEPFHYDPAA